MGKKLCTNQRRGTDLTGVFLWTPAMTLDVHKRAAPPPRPLYQDPAVLDLLEPDAQFRDGARNDRQEPSDLIGTQASGD